jgi:hypothetical protein
MGRGKASQMRTHEACGKQAGGRPGLSGTVNGSLAGEKWHILRSLRAEAAGVLRTTTDWRAFSFRLSVEEEGEVG